ncbi:MAG: DinB family protein [Acidobacteriota bacterium]
MAAKEQYLKYFKHTVESRLERLERAPDEIAEAIRGCDDAFLSHRPAEGKWSAKEAICHLRDEEEQCILRFQAMLAMGDPKLLLLGDMPANPAEWGLVEGDQFPLDPARWAEERQYLRNDAGLAMAAFAKRRRETIAFLGRLTPEQWKRGSLTAHGRLTVGDWVAIIAAHDDIHLDQIRRALEGRA